MFLWMPPKEASGRHPVRRFDELHDVVRRHESLELLEKHRPRNEGTLQRAIAGLLARGDPRGVPTEAQSRGVYPLGMTALSSGVTPEPGFTYANQLLFYSRDEAKGQNGETTATGANAVIMDMNSFIWVTPKILGGAHYSAVATLPVARNSLSPTSTGDEWRSGIGDSYYLPLILGWRKEHAPVRALYGFLAPTGRFARSQRQRRIGILDTALSSGQTFYLTQNRRVTFSAFQTLRVAYHAARHGHEARRHHQSRLLVDQDVRAQGSDASAGRPRRIRARQTTAKTGPDVRINRA